MNLRDYFAQAQDEANDNFFNYGGYDDDLSFTGDDEFDGFYGDDDMYSADGDTDMGVSAPTSQPYIVVIKNTNTATAFPVTILGAYATLAFTTPNYQNNGAISITM